MSQLKLGDIANVEGFLREKIRAQKRGLSSSLSPSPLLFTTFSLFINRFT
jgi:hypothetical protein